MTQNSRFQHKPSSSTKEFYTITKNKLPSPLLEEALSHAQNPNGQALDLGCGAGKDSRYMVSKGFFATAVDLNDVTQYLADIPDDKINIVTSSFLDFNFKPEAYDFINAQWSLPFVSKNEFGNLMNKIKVSLKPGGIFTGQFFGINDEWNTLNTTKTFHTHDEVVDILKDMEVICLREKENDGTLANGTPKHWHVFHIIAKKKN